MKALMEENRALRCQLAELRAGQGVFVEICGQRFPLYSLLAEPLPANTDKKIAVKSAFSSESSPSSTETPTAIGTELSPKTTQKLVEATPISEQSGRSTFLEEIMLDEFSTAMTSSVSVWTGPTKKLEITEEEKNAALRRALIGSFILD